MTLEEFIAFQYFFDKIDHLKAKMAQFKYLDYLTYTDIVAEFCATDAYCQRKKVTVNEHISRSIFLMLDVDESGELEPEEIMIFDRCVMGQSKEAQAKADFLQMVDKYAKATKMWLSDVTGLF